jgi:hypothetical protein
MIPLSEDELTMKEILEKVKSEMNEDNISDMEKLDLLIYLNFSGLFDAGNTIEDSMELSDVVGRLIEIKYKYKAELQ